MKDIEEDGMTAPATIVSMNEQNTKKNSQKKKQERLLEYLEISREKKFTGYIKINFSQGVIGRIEKFEEILK